MTDWQQPRRPYISAAGKGDKRRPAEVPDDEVKRNWERTFPKDADPLPVWPKTDGQEL